MRLFSGQSDFTESSALKPRGGGSVAAFAARRAGAELPTGAEVLSCPTTECYRGQRPQNCLKFKVMPYSLPVSGISVENVTHRIYHP